VTARYDYLVGIVLIGLAGAGLVLTMPHPIQAEVSAGLLIALAIQAPLGWWTLRSIGTRRFQLIWSLGMLLRLAVLAIAGVVLVPAFGWQMGPALGALVAAMVALLLVEVVTSVREHSWGKG
jgi:hypothetical protein